MKCQSLFSGKKKKNISKCCLLDFLPRVQSVNEMKVNDVKPCRWQHVTISIILLFTYSTNLFI